MKGLLIKDFKMAKKHGFILLLISAIFFFITLFSNTSMYFSYYSIAMLSVMPITIIAYDEASKWNKFEAIIPVSKTKIVLEKYVLVLILVFPAIIFEGLIYFLTMNFSSEKVLDLMFLMICSSFIIPTVIFPIIFRFGYLKSRLIGGLIAGILAVSTTFINSASITGDRLIDGQFTPLENTYLIAVVAGLLFLTSLGLSVFLYKKREF